MQSVPITTKVVNSNPVHGDVYLMQHYVIKMSVIHDFLRLNILSNVVSDTYLLL